MPKVSRTRTLAVAPPDVWRVVADPHHLPRWWPRVARVETGEEDERFTQVLMTAKGRPVRADFRRIAAEALVRVAWEQELAGTPFERLLRSATTEVALAPEGPGTAVTLTVRQQLRGWARFGPFFFRRAAGRQLNEALTGLETLCG